MRAQAAEIFPKNVHFLGRLMEMVAQQLTLNGASAGSDNDANDGKDAVSVFDLSSNDARICSVVKVSRKDVGKINGAASYLISSQT
jgi:hypothetical protein